MGMVPFLWVFDANELPDVDTRSLTGWQQARDLMDRLRKAPPRANVRRQRLARLLRERFPEGAGPSVWDDGAPSPEEARNAAVWSPCPHHDHAEAVMPVVVTWARELALDVCDEVSEVYLPARGMPLPQDGGLAYLRALHERDARQPWADPAALRQAVAQGLAQVLGPLGFREDAQNTPDGADLCFARRVPAGRQTVCAAFGGPPKAERCVLTLRHHRPPKGTQGEQDDALLFFEQTLSELRVHHEPAWRDPHTGLRFIDLVMTRFWLGWLMEDLAQWGLPLLRDTGGGPATGPDIAALRQRADGGDVPALLELAAAYRAGEHLPRDLDASAAALARAAERGSASAMYNLGVCHQNGEGCAQDAAQALQWFGRAADLGHGPATFMLARCFRLGQGVPQDVAASNALTMLAQARGVAEAAPHGVVAGAGPWADLAQQMMGPGQITRVLKVRHAATVAQPPSRPAADRPPTPRPAGEAKDTLGLLLAGLGLGGLMAPLFTRALPATWALGLLAGLLIAGAVGVFRLSARLGHGSVARALLAALALLPGLGGLVCGLQLVRTLQRQPGAPAADD